MIIRVVVYGCNNPPELNKFQSFFWITKTQVPIIQRTLLQTLVPIHLSYHQTPKPNPQSILSGMLLPWCTTDLGVW